jgi:hypothetical protein
VKAVVPDAAQVRTRLIAAGARPGFAGRMTDIRYDRNGELTARGEVLRLRVFRGVDGDRAVIGWKGPASVTVEGWKERRELEYPIGVARARPEELPEALGYLPIHLLERYVEYYHLEGAEARLEWYPRMDTLIEIEGDSQGIDAFITATGLPRSAFTPEPLALFAGRFAARTGVAAALSLAELGAESPGWPER